MNKRMFQSVTRTWNPVVGCEHACTYCWAEDMALGRLQHTYKYSYGFSPRFFEGELMRVFRPGEFIFVTSMGDLFGNWVPREWIDSILGVISKYPDTMFLLQTKNPARFLEFELPPNVYAGTTIESDVDHQVSKAPPPFQRYQSILNLPPGALKFLSIEPVMGFTVDGFTKWILEIAPDIIEIGADNHNKGLPEPRSDEVLELIRRLRAGGLNVKEKPGLERILEKWGKHSSPKSDRR